MPIVAYGRQDEDDDHVYDEDLQLLDASIEDESLAFRPPERSSTPEPLTASPEDEEKSPVRIPLQSIAAAEIFKRGTAWTESTLATDDDGEVEEDMGARFQAKVEELMNPDFQNEYSEEFMDSQQIVYASAQSKSRRSRPEPSSSSVRAPGGSTAPASAPPAGRFRRAQRPSHGGNGRRRSSAAASADAMARAAAARLEADETVPVRGRQIPLAALASDDDPASAYEKWGTSVGIEEDLALALDLDSELPATSASIGSAALSESGILRELEMEAESSCDDESDDPYTSQSDYDADENFYSDDSEFYEENETEYSDDFEDSDAEVIEYSNDEFESSFASLQGESLAVPGGLASPTRTLALAVPLSPNGGSRRQKPVTTEVQWVMRNVAQSLLQPYEGGQPPVA